jgi:hypothetical protein
MRGNKVRSKARISEAAMADLARDIDSAIERRDLVSLAAFAREAELTFGMDQQAARAREVLSLLESKAAAAGRAEVLRLKASLRDVSEPTQDELVREFDRQALAAAFGGGPFSVNDHEQKEAERVAVQNAMLAAKQRRHEQQRAAQVARDAQPKGPAR